MELFKRIESLVLRGRQVAVRRWRTRLLALSLIRFLTSLLSVLLGGGCAAAPSRIVLPQAETPAASTEVNQALAAASVPAAPAADYHIGPEDVVQITLFSISEAEEKVMPRTLEVRVNQQGLIKLPLLGEIPAGGLTVSALEQILQGQYDKYLYDPQVGVLVKEYNSQRVSILGTVQKPGVYQLSGPKTLVDMLALAGGVSGGAGSQVHVYRQGPEGRQSYIRDLSMLTNGDVLVNLSVQAGDVINVPPAGMFFIDGAVGRPGPYPLGQPYTLTQALAVAGGVEQQPAKYSGIIIFRRQGPAQVEKLTIDLDKIRAGEERDLLVQADDLIVVPTSTAKLLYNRLLGFLNIGVSAPIGGAGIIGGVR